MNFKTPDYTTTGPLLFPKTSEIVYGKADMLLGIPNIHTYYGLYGEDVDIFILDDGRFDHLNFEANETEEFFGNHQSVAGVHGGLVKGTLSLQGRPVIGPVPKARIHILKFIGETGGFPDLLSAIQWVLDYVDQKRKETGEYGKFYLNGSFGTDGESNNPQVNGAFNKLKAVGVKCALAAGNEGDTIVGYPSRLSSVFSIMAIKHDKTHASFSNVGPKGDFACFGHSVLTAHQNGKDTTEATGTSFSTPKFVACMVLIDQHFFNLHGRITTFEEMYSIIAFYAEDLEAKGFDVKTGNGLIKPLPAIEDDFQKWAAINDPTLLIDEDPICEIPELSNEEKEAIDYWSRMPTFLRGAIKNWVDSRAAMSKWFAIFFLCIGTLNAQVSNAIVQKEEELTTLELKFLQYYNQNDELTTQSLDPIGWFRVVKGVLEKEWFQDIVGFLESKESKRQRLIGRLVEDKVIAGEIVIEINAKDLIIELRK